jgi:predicted transcriptional regulator
MGSRSIHTPRYRRFCTLLRTWRSDAKLTQRALAAKLGKPPSYVHKCEVAERKLDPLEFLDWLDACRVDPKQALLQLSQVRRNRL